MRKTFVMKGIALGTALCMCVNFALEKNISATDIQTRTVSLDELSTTDKYAKYFDENHTTYDEKNQIVSFNAKSNYSQSDRILFDNVSYDMEEGISDDDTVVTLTEEEIETINEMDDEIDLEEYDIDLDEDDVEIEYDCSFDMDELEFCFSAELIDESGEILETEVIYTDAIITENGGLDACIELDGETYMLSDYRNSEMLDNCSLASLIKIVTAYLSVAETAEKIKAKSNYKYNKKLEKDGKGVKKGYYVTDQSDTITVNKKAGNYRFGFTTFGNVGCEVAATYNAMISLGEAEKLSRTIYCFEAWAIEFASGWGYLGSNPLEISRYLNKKGVSYTKYTSFTELKKAVKGKTKCKIIMSRWNTKKTTGLHTFFIKKTGTNSFRGYNWHYRQSYLSRNSLQDFNDGSDFIVGYIVWK